MDFEKKQNKKTRFAILSCSLKGQLMKAQKDGQGLVPSAHRASKAGFILQVLMPISDLLLVFFIIACLHLFLKVTRIKYQYILFVNIKTICMPVQGFGYRPGKGRKDVNSKTKQTNGWL